LFERPNSAAKGNHIIKEQDQIAIDAINQIREQSSF
jgi:hypothetical protein